MEREGKGITCVMFTRRGGRFVSRRFAEGFEGKPKSYPLELSCAVAFSCGHAESFAPRNRGHLSSVACQVLIKPGASEEKKQDSQPSVQCVFGSI